MADTARCRPEAIALVDGPRRASYARLWSQSLGFAREMRRRGLRAGDRVALLLPNRIEAVAAWYGSWLAQLVPVPLNVQARARDLGPWLHHCGASIVVHEDGNAEVDAALEALAAPLATLSLRPGCSAWADADQAEWPAAAGDADPALILYTSGTTGAPKGVTLSHANLAANAGAVARYLGLGPDDTVVSVLPFYYAYGASVLHTHLSTGGCVVLEANMVFPRLVAAAIAAHRATGFSGVASTFSLLLDRGELDAHDLSSLRYLTQAGGAMPPALTRRLREALPGPRLFLMYGQTEATSRLTFLPPEHVDDRPGSVGRPIDGVDLRVVDADGRDVPAGVEGDVLATGPGVMLGYWNDSGATRRVLRGGWLHTGDRGHLDAQGFLHLSGRRSDMIKTGAHRVFPGDIEDAIQEIQGVAEAAVVGVDDAVLGQVVKAFVVAHSPLARGGDTVRAHCRARLAPYKVPRYVEFVDALPRTASGKVRRTALSQPWKTE